VESALILPQPSYKKNPRCGTEQSGGEVPQSPICHLSTYRAIEPQHIIKGEKARVPWPKRAWQGPPIPPRHHRGAHPCTSQTQLLCACLTLHPSTTATAHCVCVFMKGNSDPSAGGKGSLIVWFVSPKVKARHNLLMSPQQKYASHQS
jgi:hypothetical protein